MKTSKPSTTIIGIMSGSSLDGIDVAKVRFHSTTEFEWLETIELSYPSHWKKKLTAAPSLSGLELLQLQTEYTLFQSEALPKWLLKGTDAISWHGHTVFHKPDESFSFQLGDPQLMASRLNIPCYGHFRQADLARGGQGAPLAPIVDHHFFKSFDGCINLGGIANISFPGSSNPAIDLCGFNQILNKLAHHFNDDMDRDGKYSKQGDIDEQLLHQLNSWDYLGRRAPKSLGNQEVLDYYIPLLSGNEVPAATQMRTFIQHVVTTIIELIPHYLPEHARLLLSGGGSKNNTFVDALAQHLPKGEVKVIEEPWSTYKEAFLMAFMAYLKSQNQANVLSSSTGVPFDQITGILYQP